MKNVFEFLLEVTDRSELRLTLAILARSAAYPDTDSVSHSEIRSLTGLSYSSMGKAVDRMLARGLIIKIAGKEGDCPLYHVLWEKFRLVRDFNHQHRSLTVPGRTRITESEQLKSYFTDTGFIDLLPHALAITTDLGYGEDEMIQAVCLVFDHKRIDPPVRNRTAWFRTVFKEKLGESRAQILAFRRTSRV